MMKMKENHRRDTSESDYDIPFLRKQKISQDQTAKVEASRSPGPQEREGQGGAAGLSHSHPNQAPLDYSRRSKSVGTITTPREGPPYHRPVEDAAGDSPLGYRDPYAHWEQTLDDFSDESPGGGPIIEDTDRSADWPSSWDDTGLDWEGVEEDAAVCEYYYQNLTDGNLRSQRYQGEAPLASMNRLREDIMTAELFEDSVGDGAPYNGTQSAVEAEAEEVGGRRAKYSAKTDRFLNNGIIITGILLVAVLLIAFLV